LAGNIPGKTATIPIAIYFAVESDDLERAIAWCLVDVTISLALLGALYYWTRSQTTRTSASRWARN
jgi:molybdate transport system permease protein